MRVITSVQAHVSDSPNEIHVRVTNVNVPGHASEPWFVRPGPGNAWLVTRLEDSRGKLDGWTVETSDLASALEVCLVGVPAEERRRWPEDDGLCLMDNGRALPGYVEVQRDDEADVFDDDIDAATKLCELTGFADQVYEQVRGGVGSDDTLVRYEPGTHPPGDVVCVVVPRHVAVARYGEENVP